MFDLVRFELKKLFVRRASLIACAGILVMLCGIMTLNIVQTKTASDTGEVLNGTAACTQTGGTDTYTLTLDEAGAAEFAAAIAPDIQSQHVAFTGGRVTMEVQDTQLCSVRITCSGSISVALTEANASLSADIRFVSRNYPFPRAVLNALQ